MSNVYKFKRIKAITRKKSQKNAKDSVLKSIRGKKGRGIRLDRKRSQKNLLEDNLPGDKKLSQELDYSVNAIPKLGRKSSMKRVFEENDDGNKHFDDDSFNDDVKLSQSTRKKDIVARKELTKKWIENVISGGLNQLKKEFKSVPSNVSPDDCLEFYKNIGKNRYPNMPCFDRTRFIISDDESFYINANKVKICNKVRFICTQAPTELTISDFWKMIVASETEKIVMLCSFSENGVSKCAKYYPELASSLDLDHFRITNENGIDSTNDIGSGKDKIIQSNLKILIKSTNKEIKLLHYQWASWQDHGMPECPDTALRLLAIVRKTKKPTVVHCSAGVGRTGTLVFIESLIMSLRYPKLSNPKESFSLLRKDRAKMVQTFSQFVFAHRCVLEYLFSKGFEKNEENWETFKTQYAKLMSFKRKGARNAQLIRRKSSVSMEDDGEEKIEIGEKNENQEKHFETSKSSAENGIKTSSENGIKTSSENGIKTSSENGIKTSSENGIKTSSENGTKTSAENGIKTSSENGAKTLAENGIKPLAENGIKPSENGGATLAENEIKQSVEIEKESNDDLKKMTKENEEY